MKVNKEITIETIDEEVLKGELIDTVELNRIAHKKNGLTYFKNIMGDNSQVYMYFSDGKKNYFVLIGK